MNGFSHPRYRQQVILKGFGEASQQKLMHARVLVVGAGGLGCASLLYLAAAGVGTLGIADDDRVQVSNLHRQILYTPDDAGALKAEIAASRINSLNEDVKTRIHPFRLLRENIREVISDYDLVLDGTDNAASRYLLNDACMLAGIPLVYAAVSAFEGQLAVFNFPAGDPLATCYRDIFPMDTGVDLSCNDLGVVGVLPGIMGCLQCNEAIKIITGLGNPLQNSLQVFNALTGLWDVFRAEVIPENRSGMPGDWNAFQHTDYGFSDMRDEIFALHADEFEVYIHREDVTLIDVREEDGRNTLVDFAHVRLPLSRLRENASDLGGQVLITFCERGLMSLTAARILREKFGIHKIIHSLEGGLSALKMHRNVTKWTKK